MIKSSRRIRRLKLGQSERFEQSLWFDDNRPHLIVDTREPPNRCVDVAWSPNDEMVAASTNGGVKVWRLSPKSAMSTFRTSDVQSVVWAFSPDGRLLASGSPNGTLTVWDLTSGNRLWSRRAHSEGIATLRFGPRSLTVVTIGYNGAVKIWGASPAKLLRAIPARKQSLYSCAISENAQLVALSSQPNLTFINTRTNSQRVHKMPDEVWIESAVFDTAGRILATGNSNGIVQFWNPRRTEQPREFSTLFGDSQLKSDYTGPDPILSLAFGRKDLLLAAGTSGGKVAVWEIGSGSVVDSINAHSSHVMGVAFSHDGRMLATCGGLDRIVKIWSVGRQLRELVTLIALGDDDWAAVTPDDRFDASSRGLDHLYWVDESRPVPAKLLEQPRDPTILSSIFSPPARRRRTLRKSSFSLPRLSKPVSSQNGKTPTPVLTVRTRPAHRVCSITWSEDDALLISGSEDGNIDLWDRATGRELRTLRGHDNAVTSLACAGPDMLASGARDGTMRIWNIRSGQLLHTFTIGLPDSGVSIASVTPNGLLICASYEGTIRWLDLGLRARLHTERILWEEEGITSLLNEMVIVSPDGRMAIRPYDRDQVAVFDLPSNCLKYEFQSIDTPGRITFEKNSRRFAVGGATTRQTIIIGGGEAPIERPTKTHAVDIRQTKSGKLVESHLGHLGNVVALAFSPDDTSVATGSLDGTARIWKEKKNHEQLKIKTPSDAVKAVAYNRDGSLLATGEGNGPFEGRISVWNTRSGKQVQSFERHIGDVHPVRFSPDGTLLAAAGEDGIVWVWRLGFRTPPTQIKGHTGRIFSLAFSPNGKYIATASWDGTSRLWRTDTGELVWMLDSRENVKVWSVAFDSDGLTLATGCNDGSVSVWEVVSGKPIWTIEPSEAAHRGEVFGLSFAPHGGLLATGGRDQRIVLWDIRSRKARKALAHDAAVFSLDFNNDGTLLASGDLDQEICLWDMRSHSMRRRLEGHLKPGHIEKGTSVRFSHDGKCIASGGTDGTLRLWNPNTGEQLAAIEGHAGPIASIAFNHDSTLLAAGSNDASASIWDVRDPTAPMKICNLYSFHDDTWAVVDKVGRFDAANGGDIPWLHWVIGLETVALSQLKERYFEPNLLPKLMGADSEPLRNVPSLTKVELHPDVELLSVKSNGGRARVRLTNRGGGIGRVVVSINGKEANADARGKRRDPNALVQNLSIDVERHPFLKPGKNVCEVRAYNAEGYLVGRQLRWVCLGPKKKAEVPKLWAVVAGISDYQGTELDLRFAAKDAADIAAAVRLGATRLFGDDRIHVRLLVAPQNGTDVESLWPTRQNLLRAFEEATAAKSTDILLVYLAGHGVSYGDQDGDYYYLTADARTGNLVDPAVRQQTAISSRELTEWIRQVPALKQVVILDTCASGRFVEKLSEGRTIPSSQARALERLKDRMGTYILAGSAADAVSYESSRYGQGLLTYSVLFGMRGAALRDDEFVDVARLFEYAADYVPKLAAGLGGIQRPLIASPTGGSSFDIGWLDRNDRERIPLAIIRPLILAVSLEEEVTWKDSLDVTRAVNAALREQSVGAEASINFIDARDHPDAYQLRGRYEVNGDQLTMKLKLFLREELAAAFDLTGQRSGVDAFARELAKRTISEVVKHFSFRHD